MNKNRKFVAGLGVCALLAAATAWGQPAPPPPGRPPAPPMPGSLNYMEGQASIGGMPLAPSSVGFIVLGAGQTLTTQAGKVEVLLTPGMFLRVAENSSVKMVSPELANTRVEVDKGRAMIEVLEIRKENNIQVDQNGGTVKLLEKGLYEFDADHAEVRVFKGKAALTAGGQTANISGGHQAMVAAAGKPKSQGFDAKAAEDDFYRWNSLRSGYLSEASVSAARAYMGPGPAVYGPGWVGWGWYWDPYFGVFTFLPADGVFWGPFGWGFFSPFYVYRSPFFYHPGVPHGFGEFHYPWGHGIPAEGGRARGGRR